MTYLVTGATGNVGRNVVELLSTAGAEVRAMTRNPVAARFPAGVDVVKGDLTDADASLAALTGVDRVYMFPIAYLSSGEFSFDNIVVNTEFPALAAKAGVRRIVLLSSNAVLYGGDEHHMAAEAAVEDSGLEYTFLRSGEFCMNKLFVWGEAIRSGEPVRSGYPNTVGVPVHEADVAAVAAAALLDDVHVGAKYEMTGPQALTDREQVAEIAAGIGRDIAFEVLTPEAAREAQLAAGMPPQIIDELMEHSARFEATPPPVVNTVQEVTGRPGRTLREWARDHTADFTA